MMKCLTVLTFIISLFIGLIQTSNNSFGGTNWSEVDCRKINNYNTRQYCFRKQLEIQREISRRSGRNSGILQDRMDQVDCVRIATTRWGSKRYNPNSLRERIALSAYKKTVREVRRKSFKTDESCVRWLVKTYNKYTNRCEKWLDRNSVYLLRNGRPWTRNRGYLQWPSYCR